MSDQAEQNILRAIAELKGDISRLDQRVQSLDQKVQALEARLESEVRRWDERFFKFAQTAITVL